eukprot:CAMPEP_0172505358 /NCGR_PEP_ID=MMETSP1066-20121228/185853_1 /TAXON_ID=671091 /ORGANISM="Coscinodiscus wailesii, Strain CCMP2513" /LENGTH=676 /DNA_ID=CAMNT_0013281935 /DNA_START=257 /DNA_END=2284 /DNA_ORIENTATION=-
MTPAKGAITTADMITPRSMIDPLTTPTLTPVTSTSSLSSTSSIPTAETSTSTTQMIGLARGGAFAVLKPISETARRTVQYVTQSPYTKRKIIILVAAALILSSTLLFASLYTFHRGFRRTIQFWRGLAPPILEYKLLKFRAKLSHRIDIARANDEDIPPEYRRQLRDYHERTAPKIVNLILEMGGIYVKMGQMMSTLGNGILDPSYVSALRPLQDGVPARSYEDVAAIIETSTGRSMSELFVSFDERPVGSASIAQAHRAVLRGGNVTANDNESGGDDVIVKIQYPEVAELFEADLDNLEMVTKLFMPENVDLVKSLRKRHENELDFTIEASNLREVAENMKKHGLAPKYVRIPSVKNETGLCGRDVLVMEYLEGSSLADVIETEQRRFARAVLGEDANADDLKMFLGKKMKEHFARGGGEVAGGDGDTPGLIAGNENMVQRFGSKIGVTLATKLFRVYVSGKEGMKRIASGTQHALTQLVAALSGGQLNVASPSQQPAAPRKAKTNLSKILKTLIKVHGVQLLKDGVYNADPHPGNVLVLPDGRLGLLDYGMVGRVSPTQRETISRVVTALAAGDKVAVARLYTDGGYRVSWAGDRTTSDGNVNVLHRFATFHFDKIDFSKVALENGETADVLEILRSVREIRVPDWVEQGRRLTGLLMGVSAQAGRPVRLAKEW